MQKKGIVKILSLLLGVFVACLVFAGCGSGETPTSSDAKATSSSGKKISIGVSIGTLKEERWQREIDMFKDFAAKNNIDLKVQSAEDDVQKQLSQCENLINQGVDVLIVQALDGDAAGAIVQPAHDAGIPVISYDRFIRNSDLDYYVTFDTVKVGEAEAKFVVSKAPKGNYIWLKGGPTDYNATLIYQGNKNVLQPLIDKGDIKIVLEQWCKDWDPKEALSNTENGLTKVNNDIQGIIAPNDGTAGGAVQALTAQGLAGKVPICGQDADLAACQRIVEGTQTGTVYKPLKKLNDSAIQLALALAQKKDAKSAISSDLGSWTKLNNGKKDVDAFTVGVVAVDQSNIYDEIVKSGFHKLEEVYKNVPKDKWPKTN